jgi:hypothetical protein
MLYNAETSYSTPAQYFRPQSLSGDNDNGLNKEGTKSYFDGFGFALALILIAAGIAVAGSARYSQTGPERARALTARDFRGRDLRSTLKDADVQGLQEIVSDNVPDSEASEANAIYDFVGEQENEGYNGDVAYQSEAPDVARHSEETTEGGARDADEVVEAEAESEDSEAA